MAKLVSKNVDIADRRVEDSTDGSEFVLAHNQTESDIGEIFGIPDKQNITRAIFGSVRSDGGIQLIRFKSKRQGSSPTTAIGIEFRVGTVRKRLSFANSEIRIWTLNPNTGVWTSGVDFESDEEPSLISKSDCIYLAGYSDEEELVGVTSTADRNGKYWFTYYPKTAISNGYTKWKQMGDVFVPLSEYKPGRIMMVNDSAADPKFTLIMPPGDTQQYALCKSATLIAEPKEAKVALGWQKDGWAPGLNISNGEYDDDISITGDVYYPFSEFVVDKGVYNIRMRLQVDATPVRDGFFTIYLVPLQEGGAAHPDRVCITPPLLTGKAFFAGEFIYMAKVDNTRFRFEVYLSQAKATQSCTLFAEIERVN